MPDGQRIYLDNAATSWPKPEAVYEAVDRYQRELGAPAGRSAYREANEVERMVDATRRQLCETIGAEEPRRIVFTGNATDALNLALHGLLRPGDHVVTSVVEHNSVLRPLRYLEQTREVQVTRVGCDCQGVIDPDEIRAALRPATRLITLIHASNVTGALQPVEHVARIAKQREILLLVDAAQSLGHVPIDVRTLGADLLAAPGHKALLGPLGTGFLYIAPGVEQHLSPVRQGGTGTQSENDMQPDSLPDRYESGNHNVPGIVGLGAGLAFVRQQGIDALRRHELSLTEQLLAGLRDLPGVTIYGPSELAHRVGVVGVTVDGWEPQDLATALDTACRVQVRAGFQCAPLQHRALGTATRGGTVRFSLGAFNTQQHIEAAVQALAELAATPV
ncbi:MAG: aminotransferase class V-fold PLP-dependent enzyme [Pirellulaceae bacterium]|nr:aminotransferase class V-fold PLP-dependent enzyme [Pirellulaceae bacterium]